MAFHNISLNILSISYQIFQWFIYKYIKQSMHGNCVPLVHISQICFNISKCFSGLYINVQKCLCMAAVYHFGYICQICFNITISCMVSVYHLVYISSNMFQIFLQNIQWSIYKYIEVSVHGYKTVSWCIISINFSKVYI